MGVKSIYVIMGFTLVSILGQLLVIFTPQYTVSFFTLVGIRVSRVKLFLLWVTVQEHSSDMCTLLQKLRPDAPMGWCYGMEGTMDVQGFQQRMCTPAFNALWPGFCSSLQWAYSWGMLLSVGLLVNMGLLCGAIYLLCGYAGWGKKERFDDQQQLVDEAVPTEREYPMYLTGQGLVAVSITTIIYGAFCLYGLTDINNAVGLDAVISVSKGFGVSLGYIVLCIALLFQLIALMLYPMCQRVLAEELYLNRKAEEGFRKQQAEMRGYGAFDHSVANNVNLLWAGKEQQSEQNNRRKEHWDQFRRGARESLAKIGNATEIRFQQVGERFDRWLKRNSQEQGQRQGQQQQPYGYTSSGPGHGYGSPQAGYGAPQADFGIAPPSQQQSPQLFGGGQWQQSGGFGQQSPFTGHSGHA